MATQQFADNASTTLSGSILGLPSPSTTLSVVDGSKFPSLPGGTGDYFFFTLDDGAGNIEVVKCLYRASNTFGNTTYPLVRGVGGVATAFSTGVAVELRANAEALNDMSTLVSGEAAARIAGDAAEAAARTTAIAAVNSVPTGTLFDFAGGSAPTGYLLCDGSAVSRATYATLFAIISTTWGVGDGSTTFNVPDLRGRATIGAGTGSGLTARTLATSLGVETVASGDLPNHTHAFTTGTESATHTHTDAGHAHNVSGGGGTGGGTSVFGFFQTFITNLASAVGYASLGTQTASHTHSGTTDATGGGTAMGIIQPSTVVTKIIKT